MAFEHVYRVLHELDRGHAIALPRELKAVSARARADLEHALAPVARKLGLDVSHRGKILYPPVTRKEPRVLIGGVIVFF